MQMGGLAKRMKLTRWTFMISCLAIAGIAPFSGFFSKDEILAGAWGVEPPGWPPWTGKVFWAGLIIAALVYRCFSLPILKYGRGKNAADPPRNVEPARQPEGQSVNQ